MSYHKSKVTVQYPAPEKNFVGNFGQMYVHEIGFEDGNKGEYNSKDPNQQKFVLGQVADYELVPSTNDYAPHIKPYNPEYDQQAQTVAQEIAPGPAALPHIDAHLGPAPIPIPPNAPPTLAQQSAEQNKLNTMLPKFTNQQAINRAVALKAAIESTDLNSEGVNKALERADAFSDWLEGYAKSFTE